MNKLPQLPRILIRNWAAACYSCGWFYPVADPISGGPLEFRWLHTICGCLESRQLDSSYDWVEFRWLDTSYGWLHPMADSSSGGWIRVAAVWSSGSWLLVTADSVLCLTRVLAAGYQLRLSQVPAAGYMLQLTPSYSWLYFRQLNTSSCWLHPTADCSSSSWIRVVADSILWLTRVSWAGYELQLTLSHGWLVFWWLDTTYRWFILGLTTSCDWLYPATDSRSGSWTRNAVDLYFNTLIYQVNLRTYSTKYILFFVFYHLISVATNSGSGCYFKTLEAAWRNMRKLEEASRF